MTDGQFEGHRLGRGGTLWIEHASGKIAQLERMLQFRESRIAENERSGRVDHFLRAEVSSLQAAIAALRFHRSQVDAITGMADALGSLMVAVEGTDAPETEADAEADLEAACATAREVLASWEATL